MTTDASRRADRGNMYSQAARVCQLVGEGGALCTVSSFDAIQYVRLGTMENVVWSPSGMGTEADRIER